MPGAQLAGFERDGNGYYGTLGCFARDADGVLGFITNQHVADRRNNTLYFPEHVQFSLGNSPHPPGEGGFVKLFSVGGLVFVARAVPPRSIVFAGMECRHQLHLQGQLDFCESLYTAEARRNAEDYVPLF